MRKAILTSILLLCFSCPLLRAQIWGGSWVTTKGVGSGTSCYDFEVNTTAACTLAAYCTDPPNPISGFTIGGSVNQTCSNQPVDNLVDVWKADAMTEEVETSAVGAFWGRTIVDQERSGNCNGGEHGHLEFL
jgi:hypothetical protein